MVEVLRRRPAPAAPQPQTQTAVRVVGSAPDPRDLPPRIPHDLKELTDAIELLGAYVNEGGGLRVSRTERLRALVGTLPTVEHAPRWKKSLRQLRALRAG